MLAIERRNAIISRLNMDGKVIVTDLAHEFEVTEETIRRDLEKLESEGIAKKTYGGAVANKSLNVELPSSVRKRTNVELKQKMAEKVSALVNDGDYIMVDASSTALFAVRCMKSKHNITLITPSIELLLDLNDKEDWNVFSTGGMLKHGGLSLVGNTAEKTVSGFHVDVAICSAKGIDTEMGVTDSNEKDAEIKRALFRSADKHILAMDSTKFDRIAFIKVFGFDDIDIVVTDQKPEDKWIKFFKDKGIELIY